MTRGVKRWFVQTATVEPFTGKNGYGVDQFSAPVALDPAAGNGCYVDDTRHLVRSTTGDQVVSEATLYCGIQNEPLFVPDSRVTIGATVTRVIKASPFTSGSLGLPDHLAVTLQ